MSLWHWIIVALIVLILFGRGRISEVMGDFGKGISSFKKGLSEDEKRKDEEPARQFAPPPSAAPADTTAGITPERDDSRP
jgi:sec-independent protein translocase protein TatA